MFPPPLIAMPIALLIGCGAVSAGFLVLRTGSSVQEGHASPLATLDVAGAVGLGALSFVSYGAVGIGQVAPWQVVAFSLLACVAGHRGWRALARDVTHRWRSRRFTITPTTAALWLLAPLALVLVGLCAINWLTPTREGDALQGYMFTARWIHEHGWTYSPFNPRYSLMPSGAEALYSVSFAFGTDAVARTLEGVAGVLFCLGVYQLARTMVSPPFALAAVVGLVTASEFLTTLGSGKIDVFSSLLLFAAVRVMLLRNPVAPRLDAVSGFLLGAACAQKYTNWILVPGIVAATLILSWRTIDRTWLRRSVLLPLLLIGACLLPHAVRNVVWTGNPVAPFATGIIPSQRVYLGHESDAMHLSAADVALFPYTLFLRPASGRWPAPLPLLVVIGVPIVLAVAALRKGTAQPMLVVAAAQLAIWIAARRSDWLVPRFIFEPVALLLVVASFGLAHVAADREWRRAAVAVLVVAQLALVGVWPHRDWRTGLELVRGRESAAAFQDRVAPGRGYGALHAIGSRLGPSARLLTGASLFNVPVETLPFVGSEGEWMAFTSTPDEGKPAYLADHRFAFVYWTGDSAPWARTFSRVAEYRGGVGFTLYDASAPAR